MAWLIREGQVLASVEIAGARFAGWPASVPRPSDDGALLLRGARGAHSFGRSVAIDIAFLDEDLTVIETVALGRNRVAVPRRRACHILEAQAGAFVRWDLKAGDRLEIES